MKAKITKSLKTTVHTVASVGEPTLLKMPTSVQIVQDAGAYFLLRLDDAGVCISDTWHASEQEAKEQARFEYDVRECDWTA